jgi:hypothetical protein
VSWSFGSSVDYYSAFIRDILMEDLEDCVRCLCLQLAPIASFARETDPKIATAAPSEAISHSLTTTAVSPRLSTFSGELIAQGLSGARPVEMATENSDGMTWSWSDEHEAYYSLAFDSDGKLQQGLLPTRKCCIHPLISQTHHIIDGRKTFLNTLGLNNLKWTLGPTLDLMYCTCSLFPSHV